jgi:predicted RNase H-like nuclease (RuvC/YqgF family)
MYIDHDELRALKRENRELKAKVSDLEDRHWNECGQIAYYQQELEAFKSGYFREVDTNMCNKQYIENLKERLEIAEKKLAEYGD